MAKRVNGRLTPLGEAQTFQVRPIAGRGLAGAPVSEVTAFASRLDDLSRKVSGASAAVAELLVETGAIKDTLLRSSAPDYLRDQARALELELLGYQQAINGNEARDLYNDIGPVSINRRVNVAMMGTFRSTYGPTPTHVQSVEIAERDFDEVERGIRRVSEVDLPDLRKGLDQAGVPWTPGRSVPGKD
jgi:hypothetical protein